MESGSFCVLGEENVSRNIKSLSLHLFIVKKRKSYRKNQLSGSINRMSFIAWRNERIFFLEFNKQWKLSREQEAGATSDECNDLSQ